MRDVTRETVVYLLVLLILAFIIQNFQLIDT